MKALLAGLLFLLSFNLQAFDTCLSGNFYDPERDGEGIQLEMLGDVTAGFFFTHGSRGTVWYALLASDGSGELDMYGMDKLSEYPFKTRSLITGNATIGFVDEDTLKFSYSLEFDIDRNANIPWCMHGGCVGKHLYTRLTQPFPCN